ncbi:MAG: DUF1549 and DUF1553 domain-containing protein [Gemmatales bacterium]|nr:DUF1549 and DUF1553 domain-containing protein [Gemmatales bacterium]MDW8223051.1 DUF1549 and DUF1553 domain-containing protein [Gemmatales bacterium]
MYDAGVVPGLVRTLSVLILLGMPTLIYAGPISLPDGTAVDNPDFGKHIMGLLSRHGCNAGACHGSFQGKGGFFLSLFGYSPEKDYQAITRDGNGRRINVVDPDQSLLLLKATGQVPHGGGQRFAKGSWQYQVIREWIARGATWEPASQAKQVVGIRLDPAEHVFTKEGEAKQFRLLVRFSDGSEDSLAQFADYRILDDYIAEVAPGGTVKIVRPGDTVVIVGYRGLVATARVILPVPVETGFTFPQVPVHNFIDAIVLEKLRKLNMVPSPLASDEEFLRRVYIDTIGQLPTPDEVRQFLTDKSPDKRHRKIEELLSHPLHAALWATKFCDITANNVDRMEQPIQLRSRRAKAWHDWFRKRIAENMSYDQIVYGVLCATSRDGQTPQEYVKQAVELEQQLSRGFENNYAERKSLDLFWRRVQGNNFNFPLEEMAEHTAAAFLGIRIECAQCHKHPFDRWSQVDYRHYANIFAQVKFGVPRDAQAAIQQANAEIRKQAGAAKPNQLPVIREIYVDNTALRRLPHPETNEILPPKAPGGPEFNYDSDCREQLFRWLVQPDNPYFARAFVNRVWAHYFGVGLVEPVDSFSAANPPSNEKLLDALARDFVAHKFDIRHLERTILQSATYQRSSRPNQYNVHDRNNYSRSYPRRMMAEVFVDVLNCALGTTEDFGQDAPRGIKAIEVAPNRINANTPAAIAFRVFGRPLRQTTCECERTPEPALPQTLFLMTETVVLRKIATGRLQQLLNSGKSNAEVLEELFLATLCRYPNDKEKTEALQHVEKRGRSEGFTDVLWALVNSREFVLNH